MARGSQNLFPYVLGAEDPPSNITAALTGILGSSGVDLSSFGGTGDGITSPEQIQAARPFAMTNPIWLNIDAQDLLTHRAMTQVRGQPLMWTVPIRRAVGHHLLMVINMDGVDAFYQRSDIRRIFDGAHSH